MSETMILETKVNLLAQRVRELQETVDTLTARMGNLERSQERLAHYVGWNMDMKGEQDAIEQDA